MNQVVVKCVSNYMNKNLLTEGENYKAYSYNEPWKLLTEEEWLNMTQEDLLVVIADNGDKISFAKWRFVRADVENIVEGAVFKSTFGVLDDIIIDEKDILADVFSEKEFEKNNVIKPNHYKSGNMDVIAFCQHHDLPFDVGNIIKYVTRAGKKAGNSELQDLNKAMEYLKRRIAFVEKQEKR